MSLFIKKRVNKLITMYLFMNPVHKSGYLKTPRFQKQGFVFEVRETKHGTSSSVWDTIDVLHWKDKNNLLQRTKISRRQLQLKFEDAELLNPKEQSPN